jgi:ubiquitin carboxyl-terminal hydrolase 5/13
MMQMSKTEKTMEELQIDVNLKLDFAAIMEEGKNLTPLSGPGLRGISNIGNSCYINSVVQTLFTIPEFKNRFSGCSDFIFAQSQANANFDFLAQLSKLAKALYQEETSSSQMDVDESSELILSPPQLKIAPRMLRVRNLYIVKPHLKFV